MPVYYYHKKDFSWEIPINNLSELLDKLTYLDAINLQLLPDDETSEISEITDLTEDELAFLNAREFKPMKHQIDAINFMLKTKSSLLLDSMGLGKSCEMIWYAEILKRRKLIEHCLIICGVNSLKQNWKKEIQKFSSEKCLVLGERITRTGSIRYTPIAARAEQLRNQISEFFTVINLEAIRDDRILESFTKSKNSFGLICFDEAHKAATKTSQQGHNLLKMDSAYKVAATGTLLTNSPLSCYVPLYWTGNDHSTLTMYKSQYCNFGGFNNSQVVGYKNLDLLKDELEHCSIRRTLDQVRDSMPQKTVVTELVEMSEADRKFYEAIRDGVKEEADKIDLKSGNLLALTTRLRQATACPSVLSTDPPESTKVDRCCEIVEELVEQGEKVVILSMFKETVAVLQTKLGRFRPSVNTGDIPDYVVSKNVDRFQNDPDEKVFIGTWAKVSTGLTLNAAAYMVCIDTPYTYAMTSQGTDRIWRVNNTRPAFITILADAGTIDERVLEIVNTKKELSEYIIDDVQNAFAEVNLNDELRKIIADL